MTDRDGRERVEFEVDGAVFTLSVTPVVARMFEDPVFLAEFKRQFAANWNASIDAAALMGGQLSI